MKKVLFSSLVVKGYSFDYPPGKVKPVEFPEIKEEIEKRLSAVEFSVENGFVLNERTIYLDDYLRNKCWNSRNYVKPETTRNIANRLIKIFHRIDGKDINAANYVRIIELVGLIDNSPDTHKFFLEILENGTDRNRDAVLRSIGFPGVSGNDIYDKIIELSNQKVFKKGKILAYLRDANLERAIKEIQDYLATTDDVAEFGSVGRLLSAYNRPELMDVVLNRYDEMHKKWDGSYRYDPASAINPSLLVKLAEIKEGKQLKTVLEMLNQDGTSGEETLPIMVKKLENKDAITREAVLDFLYGQVKEGNIKTDKVKSIVEQAIKKEGNKNLTTKADKILKELDMRFQMEMQMEKNKTR